MWVGKEDLSLKSQAIEVSLRVEAKVVVVLARATFCRQMGDRCDSLACEPPGAFTFNAANPWHGHGGARD